MSRNFEPCVGIIINVQLYVFKLPSSNFLCVLTGWAHVVCALYIPEVRFGNVTTMEPIILASVPHDRFCKVLQIKMFIVINIEID